MGNTPVTICSVSWIDQKGLPEVGFSIVAGALLSWPNRVIMGLAATSNPEPPGELANTEGFRARQQFRALIACTVVAGPPARVSDKLIDPGYTPPFDKRKLNTSLRVVVTGVDDPKFHPGESSPISSIVEGKLHPSSTLQLRSGDKVLVSAFIKFRAGPHTDAIGTDKAKSPVHVPWVWCEYALVANGSKWRLLAQGSRFPSHAWYVAGKQVAKRYQSPVAASAADPAISTGQPANLPQSNAAGDKGTGPVTGQQYTLDKGTAIDVDVSHLLS